jgi:hypothetical protein
MIISKKPKARPFFNNPSMLPESLPSAKQHNGGYNRGVFASLNWATLISVQQNQPSLWKHNTR